MTTIYKSTPGETEINITYLDDNLRFTGNDAKVINIGAVSYTHLTLPTKRIV